VREALEKYEVNLRAKGLKPRSIVAVEQRLRRLMTPMLERRLVRLTNSACSELYQQLAASGVAVATHRNTLIYARTWGKWMVGQRLWKTNLWREVEGFGKRNRGKLQLRIDEARTWMEWAVFMAQREPGPVAALLAAVMGLRAGEIVGLRCRDVDDGTKVLWVDGTKSEMSRRVLEVPQVLRDLLGRCITGRRGDDLVFETDQVAYVRRWVRKICVRAGVPIVSAHGMRGLHATLAMSAGSIAHVVAAQLGHASPDVTMRHYADAGAVAAASAKRVELVLVGNDLGNKSLVSAEGVRKA
jgi:integrase